MSKAAMLTTIDNPFDPFTQWDDWYAFDEQKGYHTSSYLARIAHPSASMSENDQVEEINRAIDEIVSYNFRGIYKKVYENSEKEE